MRKGLRKEAASGLKRGHIRDFQDSSSWTKLC